jgi:hypothetical protein
VIVAREHKAGGGPTNRGSRAGGPRGVVAREGVKRRKRDDLFSNQKLEISIALSIKTLERDALFSRKVFGIRCTNFQKKSR